MITYILDKFNSNEDIIDDTELNKILKNFLEAVNIQATQGNSSLKDYLQGYLSDYESNNKNKEMI